MLYSCEVATYITSLNFPIKRDDDFFFLTNALMLSSPFPVKPKTAAAFNKSCPLSPKLYEEYSYLD